MHRYYKPYKDSTLMRMSKKDLIEQIRVLEHNWSVTGESSERKTRLLEEICENVVEADQYISGKVRKRG